MGNKRNKKIFNVMSVGFVSALLLGTSASNTYAFDEPIGDTTVSQVSKPQVNSRVVEKHTVTLVTGEVVTVEKHSDGTQVGTIVPKEDGSPISFTEKTISGNYYLIPDEATPFLASGQLDEDLFNITKLIEYGYDDAHQSSIPLIVAKESGITSAKREAANDAVTTGATKTLELPSVNSLAVKTDKKHAEKFWDAIDGEAVKSIQDQPELTEGIKKIWLDKPVHALLDQSVKQIGAPTAWASGFDGKGIKVAVLDTGVDPTHPDLKDVVKEEKSFIPGEDFVDHHGHGTHVASTIAGSGAASDGKYKGVAPGADLIIGKVLSNEGSGDMSGIIAGMEWAVQEKADIVSMSLGTADPSDGTDPISQAVNRLSESSTTLFVIAAGNAGSKKNTVGAPGAAEKALTVGAVDKSANEFLANFSSRGPLINNYRVKPEVTAPGVSISAARAAGTNLGPAVPGNDNYMTISGTSMATPHVAGAAAIIKQSHPQWTGDHIKQVLAGTGVQNTRYTPYQQGGGRVDVNQALNANVYSSPAVISMGAAMVDDGPFEKPFNYVNPSDHDVTLNLELTAKGENLTNAVSGMFTLNQTVITIPAHSSSEVKVKFDPTIGTVQDYKVVVKASSTDGKTINTTIGATKTEPLVKVNLNTIDRYGQFAKAEIVATNLDTGKVTQIYPSGSNYKTGLQPGHYSIMGTLYTQDVTGLITESYTLAGIPMLELKLKEEKAITLDARLGNEVNISTPKESEQRGFKIGYRQGLLSGIGGVDYLKGASSPIWDHVYVVPTEPVTDSLFEYHFQQRRYAPVIKASYDGQGGAIPLEPVGFVPRLDGTKNLKAVNVGKATKEDLIGKNINGNLAVVTRDPNQKAADQIKAVQSAGAAGVVLVNNQPGIYAVSVLRADKIAIPAWTLNQEEGVKLLDRVANGPTLIDLRGIANSPYVYNIAMMVPNQIPADPSDKITAENSAVVMNHFRGDKGKFIGETTSAIRPKEIGIVQVINWIDTPLDREEWFSSGSKRPWLKELYWLQMAYPNPDNIGQSLRDTANYLPGDKREQTWFGAAMGPSQNAIAFREGDKMTLNFQEFGDSEPSHWGMFNWKDDTSTSRIYRDGNLLAERMYFSNSGPVDVSPNSATYRLTIDSQQSMWSPLSTKTSTAWTFQSSRPVSGKQDLALLWPRYDLKLDGENKTQPGSTYQFDLSFILQSGDTTNIRGAEVQVSTDDGKTWLPADVNRKNNGHNIVTYKNPKSGYVSLRIKAWDDKGSQIEQTLIRAYSVR